MHGKVKFSHIVCSFALVHFYHLHASEHVSLTNEGDTKLQRYIHSTSLRHVIEEHIPLLPDLRDIIDEYAGTVYSSSQRMSCLTTGPDNWEFIGTNSGLAIAYNPHRNQEILLPTTHKHKSYNAPAEPVA